MAHFGGSLYGSEVLNKNNARIIVQLNIIIPLDVPSGHKYRTYLLLSGYHDQEILLLKSFLNAQKKSLSISIHMINLI